MSSNFNHIIINRDNYEEFLLLYIDNELTAEQKAAVDAFLVLHPDIQAELELLQGTVLPAEMITLNKEYLFSDQMGMNSIDEQLLLYVDDELSLEERSKVAQEIEENKLKAAQYALLLQTKLDSNETVPYPHKEELYRHTKRRIFAAEWMQIAAAILVLFLGGWLWWQPAKVEDAPEITVAARLPKQDPGKTVVAAPAAQNRTATTPVSDAAALSAVSNKVSLRRNIDADPVQNKAIDKGVNNAGGNNNEDITVALNRTNTIAEPVTTASTNLSEPAINTSFVTSTSVVRNTITDNETVTEDNNSKGRSPLKGFLRKATRFIERTTGIPATNENNEVLIASVAVRLD